MIETELLSEDQRDLLAQKEKELADAHTQIEELEAQIRQINDDSDVMKGENNSLKKKVHSLQIDLEKLSRKVSTTQARSSGLASVDENYGDGYNIVIGSSGDNN